MLRTAILAAFVAALPLSATNAQAPLASSPASSSETTLAPIQVIAPSRSAAPALTRVVD